MYKTQKSNHFVLSSFKLTIVIRFKLLIFV